MIPRRRAEQTQLSTGSFPGRMRPRWFGLDIMVAKVIDGKQIARGVRAEIAAEIATWQSRELRPPGLAVILVGNDPASEVYVRGKRRDCDEVGFHSNVQHLSANVTQQDLEDSIRAIPVPTMIVTGDDDQRCLAPGLFMKELIEGSRLFVMPHTGHVLNLEEPELFNTVLDDFLSDVEAGKG